MHTHTAPTYTIWQFITGGRSIFLKGRWYFVALAAIVSLTQYGLMMGWGLLAGGAMLGGAVNRGMVFALVLLSLILLALYLYLGYMSLYLVKHLSLNQKFTLQELFYNVHTHFWPLFLTSLQKGIYTIGLFILLIIPGVIYSVYRLFNQFINVYEGVFYGESLDDSKSLIHGRWRKTLGNLFVIGLLGAFLFGFFGSLLGIQTVSSSSPSSATTAIDLLRTIVGGVLSSFFMCILASMYLAYKETATDHLHVHTQEHVHTHKHIHTHKEEGDN